MCMIKQVKVNRSSLRHLKRESAGIVLSIALIHLSEFLSANLGHVEVGAFKPLWKEVLSDTVGP